MGEAFIKKKEPKLITRNANTEKMARCQQEPWRRAQDIAASETKQNNALMTRNENIKEVARCLQESWRGVQDIEASETERINALIIDLKIWLEDLKKTVLEDISRQADLALVSASDLTQQLVIKNDKLSKTMDKVEELCNMVDPLIVLHETDTGDLYDADDRDDEDREKLVYGRGDLSEAMIPNKTHTGSSDIIPGLNGRIIISGPADILLDVNTVYNFLHLLEDRKTASYSFINKNHPETPERFQFRPQVLSTQSFSSGCHHWDVEVWRSDNWRVGMCYPSIDRKRGVQSVIGNNEKSWCLSRSHKRYSVIHDRKETHLFGSITGDTVRISLDYESGVISFYELGISAQHLHTFTTTFTEPLHAVLGVWRGCLKVCGVE